MQYNLQVTSEGKPINPSTGQVMKIGERLESHNVVYSGLRKSGTPVFLKNEVWQRRLAKQLQWRKKHQAGTSRTFGFCTRHLKNGARNRAKKYGGICTLTLDWIRQEVKKGYVVNGVKIGDYVIEVDSHRKVTAWSPSIDRIDNSNRDYTPENCRIVPSLLNLALNNFDEKDFLDIVGPYIDGLRSKT
jgi:hypothetical protein